MPSTSTSNTKTILLKAFTALSFITFIASVFLFFNNESLNYRETKKQEELINRVSKETKEPGKLLSIKQKELGKHVIPTEPVVPTVTVVATEEPVMPAVTVVAIPADKPEKIVIQPVKTVMSNKICEIRYIENELLTDKGDENK